MGLLLASSALIGAAASAQTIPSALETPTTGIADTESQGDTAQSDIIVTGNTSGNRTKFNSSSNVTYTDAADIQRKAPRVTVDLLETVPGVFVEGTAGPANNNYSVRGLRGGGQTFISLEDDGMPVLYLGGGADAFFQNDITVDRLEAVEGGTSGVLTPNGAGATINFIPLKPNHDRVEAMTRFTGATYGDLRTDGYFTSPLGSGLAFNVGGYIQSQKGVRNTPLSFNGYSVRAMLEKRFDDGGTVRLSFKRFDQHNPYYADMPLAVSTDGTISSVPGLDLKRDDVGGSAFSNILIPAAPATGRTLRRFSSTDGTHVRYNQYRLDVDQPVVDDVRLFGHARYLDSRYQFDGIFPGSGAGTAGLTSAINYLDPAVSPLANLKPLPGSTLTYFQLAAQAFPGTAAYALRNVATGEVISDPAKLRALNGNGLLQQSVLYPRTLVTKDFGSDFGARWSWSQGAIDNSLTAGGMIYNVRRFNDSSAGAIVLNDVTNNSHVYDIVAVNGAGNVLGSLTNNGLINYGYRGQGLFRDEITSLSGYFNDELRVGERLHIDFGARYEHQHDKLDIGNTASINPPVPQGTPGLYQNVGSSFSGAYTRTTATFEDWAYTGGVNYELTRNIALYVRAAKGFQTNGGDTGGTHKPTDLTLYEAGLRFRTHGLSGSLVGFRTSIKDLSYQFIDPANPAVAANALADNKTNGVQIDGSWRSLSFFSIEAQGVYQAPRLHNLRFNGAVQSQYEGNTPERTPRKLLTVTPSFILPGGLGEIYGRWKYIGRIFADSGNGIALPSYSVLTIGANVNLTDKISVSASVDNLTNAKGFTEGNPRQGQTQTIVDGYFYGRAIVGRNALVSATVKL